MVDGADRVDDGATIMGNVGEMAGMTLTHAATVTAQAIRTAGHTKSGSVTETDDTERDVEIRSKPQTNKRTCFVWEID